MRLVIDDDNAGEYIIFLNGVQIVDAFEADEETGRVWVTALASPSGYAVLYGDVSIFKKALPHVHTITGILINHGSEVRLLQPIKAKPGDTIAINITFTERSGIIESLQYVEATE